MTLFNIIHQRKAEIECKKNFITKNFIFMKLTGEINLAV